MDPGLSRIVALAWRSVPAREANEAIVRARRAVAAADLELAGRPAADQPEDSAADAEAPLARSYELVLAPDATLEQFARDQLPRLVYHLESIGAFLPAARGVVICLFEGERLHFVQAGELVAEVCQQLGITAEELSRRHGTGELRTAVQVPPLALPSGGPKQ